MKKSLFLVLIFLNSVECFQQVNFQKNIQQTVSEAFSNGIAVCVVAGSLLVANPQPAVGVSDDVFGTLETAIIEASDATYPVLQSLTGEKVSPLANKIANIVTTKIPAERLTTALDSTANTLLNIPDDKLDTFVETVKNSYQGISVDSCSSIPFPTAAASKISSSEGITKLNSEKVQQVTDKVISPLAKTVPFSEEKGICLPSKEGLEQVWIGQTKLVLSIPTPAKQQLVSDLVPAVKSIPSSELLRLLPETKKILADVDRKQVFKFQETSKALDRALKQDYRFKSLQSF